jgi:hypothetical protein
MFRWIVFLINGGEATNKEELKKVKEREGRKNYALARSINW